MEQIGNPKRVLRRPQFISFAWPLGLLAVLKEQDRTEARILSDIIDQGAYNVKPMENKNLVTLWLCWTSLTINQDSPTLTLVKKTTGKKDKAIKEEIK